MTRHAPSLSTAAAPTSASAALARKIAPPAPIAGTRRRQVIIATVNRPAGQTGVHTHTRVLEEGLVSSGFGCQVVSPFSRGPHWLAVFAIRRLFHPLDKSWSTRWYRRWHRAAVRDNLMRRLQKEQFAGVIVAQCPISADAAVEARARLKLDFPVAMVCHFNFSEAQEYREQGVLADDGSFNEILKFEQRVLSAVDRVVYVSRWAQQVVEQTRGICTRASTVIWNGIPNSSPAAISREKLGLNHDDLVFINVGTLEPRKNQVGLIDLFELVSRQEPRARLVLAGEGHDRAAITRKLEQRALTSRVMLLGHRTDVPALLPAADAYIHYSSLENCPVALLEAARAGLPVAAVATGGVPELLNNLGGIALHETDLAQSMQALRPMLCDAALRRQLGAAARQGFERFFTREAMIDAYRRALGLDD
jgi:glycosyltransferase involved in cell wall biosynthesis